MGNLGSCSGSTFFMFVLCACTFLVAAFVCVEGFDSLLQLPQSGSTRTRPRSKRVLFVGHFGAKGDGLSDDTKAFKDVWEIACSSTTQTRIIIPAGYTFLVHPVDLAGPCRSKISLTISGTIIAPKDPDAWKGLNPRKWLYFHGVNHLYIEGGGTINGMGRKWWARSCKIHKENPCRHAPTAITFHRCKYLKVKNIRLIYSQQMHIAFTNCMRVLASGLRVIAPACSPNTDGIHISASRGVVVKDSIVRTGDDCISVVSNSSRIQIRNFVCGPGHGISIGSLGKSNSSSQVRDVLVDGASLSNTDNGLRIKTWQGGRGNATDIKFQNVLMDNVSNPIIIDQYYCDSQMPCANQVWNFYQLKGSEFRARIWPNADYATLAVKVKNVSFVNIKGTSATEEAISFACSDDSPCEGLYLEDIQLLSNTGWNTTAFCWEAYGSSLGAVYPPACFSCSAALIKQKVLSKSALQST